MYNSRTCSISIIHELPMQHRIFCFRPFLLQNMPIRCQAVRHRGMLLCIQTEKIKVRPGGTRRPVKFGRVWRPRFRLCLAPLRPTICWYAMPTGPWNLKTQCRETLRLLGVTYTLCKKVFIACNIMRGGSVLSVAMTRSRTVLLS